MEIESIAHEYNQKVEEYIRFKLSYLQREVEHAGDLFLGKLLYELAKENKIQNMEEITKKIERYGYRLEIDYPKTSYEFKESDFQYKATVDLSGIKIRLVKIIAEV